MPQPSSRVMSPQSTSSAFAASQIWSRVSALQEQVYWPACRQIRRDGAVSGASLGAVGPSLPGWCHPRWQAGAKPPRMAGWHPSAMAAAATHSCGRHSRCRWRGGYCLGRSGSGRWGRLRLAASRGWRPRGRSRLEPGRRPAAPPAGSSFACYLCSQPAGRGVQRGVRKSAREACQDRLGTPAPSW